MPRCAYAGAVSDVGNKQGATVRDKSGRLAAASAANPIDIELGPGHFPEYPDAIGIDVLDLPTVDVVGDVRDVVAALPDDSVRSVYSSHFFEHIDDPIGLLDALARVVRPGGTVTTVVPHFANPYFYSDPTHRAAFGLYTFSYLARDEILRREVPHYFGSQAFELVDVQLIFKSTRPYYLRHGMSKAVQRFVNSSRRRTEKFEARWVYFWPPHEIRYVVRRLPRPPITGI